jgi:Zonula occludens toxin
MIYLTCGTPGAGKTLWTISTVEKLRQESGREVYYHGITDLALEWQKLDDPKQWNTLPEGSIIVIDECQGTFPNRRQTGVPPEHISALETHRHKGYDIFLITQNPQLMDNHVRKLVGEYRFLDRPSNLSYVVIHKFRHVVDWKNQTERKGAEKERWKYPKEAFNWYKSAEVHTHKVRLPRFLIWIPVLLGVIGICIYSAYNVLSGKNREDRKNETVSSTTNNQGIPSPVHQGTFQGVNFQTLGQDQQARPLTKTEYLALWQPRVYEMPYSAPIYDEIARPTTFPVIGGCVKKGNECRCFSQQATHIKVEPSFCENYIEYGQFNPFRSPEQAEMEYQRQQQEQQRQQHETALASIGTSPATPAHPIPRSL